MSFTSRRYKYIIIDTQIEDLNNLKQHLDGYSNFYCAGMANCKSDAVNLILEERPTLVFFNTELHEGIKIINSFEIISELRQYLDLLPQFIALSDSQKHSYQAIKNGVFDYLLKPLNHFELKKTVLKFEKTQPKSFTVCLKSFAEYKFLSTKDILFLKADNNTTDFYLKDGSMVTSCQTLKDFEISLPNIFVRIHKSYIVNVNFISKIHFSKFYCTLKLTKQIIPFSRKLKSEMLEIREFLMSSPSNIYA